MENTTISTPSVPVKPETRGGSSAHHAEPKIATRVHEQPKTENQAHHKEDVSQEVQQVIEPAIAAPVVTKSSIQELPHHDPLPKASQELPPVEVSEQVSQQSTPAPQSIPTPEQEVPLSQELQKIVEQGSDTEHPLPVIVQRAGMLRTGNTPVDEQTFTGTIKLPISYTHALQIERRTGMRDSVKWLAREVMRQWERFRPDVINDSVVIKEERKKLKTTLLIIGSALVIFILIGVGLQKFK